MTISEVFKAHVDYLEALAEAGDEMATRTLGCMALLAQGWHYGDPDPVEPPDDDPDGMPLPENVIPMRRAA